MLRKPVGALDRIRQPRVNFTAAEPDYFARLEAGAQAAEDPEDLRRGCFFQRSGSSPSPSRSRSSTTPSCFLTDANTRAVTPSESGASIGAPFSRCFETS